jgi:hypothetical protein
VKRNQRLVASPGHPGTNDRRGGQEHSSAATFLIQIQENDDLDFGVYHPRGIALPCVD